MKANYLILTAVLACLSAQTAYTQQASPVQVRLVQRADAGPALFDEGPSPFTAANSAPNPPEPFPSQYPGKPVPAPRDGGEYVPSRCDCGQHDFVEPSCNAAVCRAPSCGAEVFCAPSCGADNACCTGCADPSCCCGGCGCGIVIRDVLNDLLPCDKCGCANCACECGPWRLFPALGPCGNWDFYGWLNAGGFANSYGATYSGPVTFADRNEVQFNQAYAILERTIDTSGGGWDLGARVDLLYGSDYIFTETNGLERQANGAPRWNSSSQYGLAMPQAYLELGVNDWRMKLGHFYTIMGYESVMAPMNFFQTHAYTMQFGEPFTHTGMLMSYDYSDTITLHSGLVNGWDQLDGVSDHLSYLGGINYSPSHGLYDVAFTLITGYEPAAGGARTSARTLSSIVLNMHLTENLNYVIQSDIARQNNFFPGGGDAEWYGINQYLFYDVNDCWTLGGRFEWFRDDDGVRVTGVRPGNPYPGGSPGNFWEVALGLNWRATDNLVVRPEMRWDWYDGAGVPPFNANTRGGQYMGGMDVIWQW